MFSYLGEQDGLSDNIVNCFLEDSRGMLWVGTYNGLNSFDGAAVQQIFPPSPLDSPL